MLHTKENIATYIKECVTEYGKYGLTLSDEHVNLLASYIRMQMTHGDRLEIEKDITAIVNDIQNKFGKGK